MLKVQQNNPSKPIPFLVRQPVSPYAGDPGKTITAQIRKPGGSWGPAAGTVADLGFGYYELQGAVADRDTLGIVLVQLAGPAGDLIPGDGYEVVAYDPDAAPSAPVVVNVTAAGLSPTDSANLAAAMTSLASIDATMQKIATAERAK